VKASKNGSHTDLTESSPHLNKGFFLQTLICMLVVESVLYCLFTSSHLQYVYVVRLNLFNVRTVGPGYNDMVLCSTLSVVTDILSYRLSPHC
jgi:hypothetical protein